MALPRGVGPPAQFGELPRPRQPDQRPKGPLAQLRTLVDQADHLRSYAGSEVNKPEELGDTGPGWTLFGGHFGLIHL